jgi:hypothetical protein
MKKLNAIFTLSMLLLIVAVLLIKCKKDDNPVVPEFTVSFVTVPLQGGGDGLQFSAKCTNTDVKMTKVTITDPQATGFADFNFNSQTFVKNELFDLQDQDVAYLKESGTWTFNFVGNRTSDNDGFAVDASVSVSK